MPFDDFLPADAAVDGGRSGSLMERAQRGRTLLRQAGAAVEPRAAAPASSGPGLRERMQLLDTQRLQLDEAERVARQRRRLVAEFDLEALTGEVEELRRERSAEPKRPRLIGLLQRYERFRGAPELAAIMDRKLASLEPQIALEERAHADERWHANMWAATAEEAAERFPGRLARPYYDAGTGETVHLVEDRADPRLEEEMMQRIRNAEALGGLHALEGMWEDPEFAAITRIPGNGVSDFFLQRLADARGQGQPEAWMQPSATPATGAMSVSAERSVALAGGASTGEAASQGKLGAPVSTGADGARLLSPTTGIKPGERQPVSGERVIELRRRDRAREAHRTPFPKLKDSPVPRTVTFPRRGYSRGAPQAGVLSAQPGESQTPVAGAAGPVAAAGEPDYFNAPQHEGTEAPRFGETLAEPWPEYSFDIYDDASALQLSEQLGEIYPKLRIRLDAGDPSAWDEMLANDRENMATWAEHGEAAFEEMTEEEEEAFYKWGMARNVFPRPTFADHIDGIRASALSWASGALKFVKRVIVADFERIRRLGSAPDSIEAQRQREEDAKIAATIVEAAQSSYSSYRQLGAGAAAVFNLDPQLQVYLDLEAKKRFPREEAKKKGAWRRAIGGDAFAAVPVDEDEVNFVSGFLEVESLAPGMKLAALSLRQALRLRRVGKLARAQKAAAEKVAELEAGLATPDMPSRAMPHTDVAKPSAQELLAEARATAARAQREFEEAKAAALRELAPADGNAHAGAGAPPNRVREAVRGTLGGMAESGAMGYVTGGGDPLAATESMGGGLVANGAGALGRRGLRALSGDAPQERRSPRVERSAALFERLAPEEKARLTAYIHARPDLSIFLTDDPNAPASELDHDAKTLTLNIAGSRAISGPLPEARVAARPSSTESDQSGVARPAVTPDASEQAAAVRVEAPPRDVAEAIVAATEAETTARTRREIEPHVAPDTARPRENAAADANPPRSETAAKRAEAESSADGRQGAHERGPGESNHNEEMLRRSERTTVDGSQTVYRGRTIPEAVLDRVQEQRRIDPGQIERLRILSEAARRRAAGARVTHYYGADATGDGDDSVGRSGEWDTRQVGEWRRDGIVGFEIAQDGGVTVHAVDDRKLQGHAEAAAKTEAARAAYATAGQNIPGAIIADAHTFLNNVAEGRPGTEGLGAARGRVIGDLFGVARGAKVDFDALTAADKLPEGALAQLRFERMDRLVSPEATVKRASGTAWVGSEASPRSARADTPPATPAEKTAPPDSDAPASDWSGPRLPRVYSIAFVMRLAPEAYPGRKHREHFREANEALLQAMEASPEFAQAMKDLGIHLKRTRTGRAPDTSPKGWTWHHAPELGRMELVPFPQHKSGSPWQKLLHPDGYGGYLIWGK